MKAKKVLFSALSMMIALSAFAGCGGGGGSRSSSVEEKLYTSLADENWEPETLKSNGESLASYKIVISASASKSTEYAAEILQTQINRATKVTLPIITDATAEGTHEILLGETTRTEDDNVNYAELGEESYIVKSVGNDLVVAANARGVLYGTYAYLEALGYRFYAPAGTLRSATMIDKVPSAKNVFIAKDVELTWTPTFEFRDVLYRGATTLMDFPNATGTCEWSVAQRVNSNYCREDLKSDEKYGGSVGYMGGNAYMVHTARQFLPYSPGMYQQHPDWFASKDGQLLVSGKNGYDTEICWSNEEALDYIYERMLSVIAKDKGDRISISMNDTNNHCQCETCSAQQAEYGVSGWFFRAVNKLARRLKVDHPELKVDTIAYAFAIDAPDIVMEDNVIVRLCLSPCRWHSNIEECTELGGPTQAVYQRLLDWQDHASEFFVYHYPVNWANTVTIDPSYQAMYTHYKWFAEHGVKGMYCEGYVVDNGEFSELKAYLTAKLLANPLMSYGEYQYHMRDFLEGYYGDGWEYIQEYIDTTYDIIMTMMAKSNNWHIEHWYTYENNFPFEDYYDLKTRTYSKKLDEINQLWSDAEELATPEQADRIRKSSLHWTYVDLYNTFENRFANEDTRDEVVARNEQLYRDMKRLGVTKRHSESADLGEITSFIRSPKTWWTK